MEIIKFNDFMAKNYENSSYNNENNLRNDILKAILIILAVVIFGSDFMHILEKFGGMPLGGNDLFQK